jgi:protease I
LISADVLKNKKLTGWKSIKQDIINAGGVFIDAEVVEDDNLISSRSPQDLDIFIETCLKKLEKNNVGGKK